MTTPPRYVPGTRPACQAPTAKPAALRDYGEPAADALAQSCPYILDQIVGDWLP